MLRLILLAFKAKLKGRVCKCVCFFKMRQVAFYRIGQLFQLGIHFANVSVNTDTAYISLLPRLVSSIIYNN